MNLPKCDEILKQFTKAFLEEAIFTGTVEQEHLNQTRYQYANGTVVYLYRDKVTNALVAINTGDGDSYSFEEETAETIDVKVAEALMSIYSWDIVGK